MDLSLLINFGLGGDKLFQKDELNKLEFAEFNDIAKERKELQRVMPQLLSTVKYKDLPIQIFPLN